MDLSRRMKQLKGCERQGGVQLEGCSRCGERLPLLWVQGEGGCCPRCGGFLGAGAGEAHSPEGWREAEWSRAEFETLFGNSMKMLGESSALLVEKGQRLCYVREDLCGWSAQEEARRMGERAETIEQMDLWVERELVSFTAYWDYARTLGSHLIPMLTDARPGGALWEGRRVAGGRRGRPLLWRRWEERYHRMQQTQARWERLRKERARETVWGRREGPGSVFWKAGRREQASERRMAACCVAHPPEGGKDPFRGLWYG